MDRLKRLNARITNKLFIVFKRCQSNLFSKRKIKILFSRKREWEHFIRWGFKFTQHVIAFDEFTPKNIKEYDLVVPLTIRDLKYLNKVRHLINDNLIPIPTLDSIVLCDDKYLLNQALAANGFGNFVPKMGGALTYPYILKKRIDEWGRNSHIISGAQAEERFSEILTHSDYFRQELIPGPFECATHILFQKKIICSITIEYAFKTKTPIKGKDNASYTQICCCPYLDLFSAILSSVGFDGLCCFNYKVQDNRPLILEINPRFGGSLSPLFFSFIGSIA